MPPHLAACLNVNHLWAALLVEELVRQGTTLFVVCPGSRSTPLAVAVAHNPRAEAVVHWDERAAAFVALGWGRATGRPAAVVTTSGTAVANLLPAAVEADADGVPLLLITADRPPELRETGANQTVRQPPVFQDVARWSLDWPVPTQAVPARWVLSTAAHAAHRAVSPSGPVHLNLPFREPLGAQSDGTDPAEALADLPRWPTSVTPWVAPVTVRHADNRGASDEIRSDILTGLSDAHGVIVVGDLGGDDRGERAAVELARELGWPLLPDLRSGLRLSDDKEVIPFVDLALLASSRATLYPDAVVHLGGRIVSKRLSRFLVEARPQTYVGVSDRPERIDPDSLVTHRLAVPVHDGVVALQGVGGPGDSAWMGRWRAASEAVSRVIEDALVGDLSEPAVARRTAQASTEAGALVVAASMPVRDVEAFGAVGSGVRVVANRGASGIDGTVATAHGVARGLDAPVVALVGDLALLHDLTSLGLLADGPPVVVVVVNNDGGGIFHRLPIAGDAPGALTPETFERFFGTPHGLRFEDAARQFGLAYHGPTTLQAFDDALTSARRSGASALIEVKTDREEQAELRRRIESEVAAAVDAALADGLMSDS